MKQPEVRIYTTPWCPFCIRAKSLLKKKDVVFEDTDVSFDTEMRKNLAEQTGRTTVPQIFIDGRSIGGCDELYALDRDGKLDLLLGRAQASPA